jgi:S-adenosylmethionine/arginine decarboxylase-like enzyme
MKTLFHQHLLVKAWVNNAPTSEESLNSWLRELVSCIDMKICIEPRSQYVDAPGNRGLTGQIGIETSHIAIHIWDEEKPGMLQMDVYSCKCFDTKTVIDKIAEWNLTKYECMTIDRNEEFSIKEHSVVILGR